MSDFSKAKWKVQKVLGKVIGVATNRSSEFSVEMVCSLNDEANARLIAVAPEMYEMMENTSHYILECAKLYSPFLGELCMYAERIKELLARIDGEDEYE